MNEFPATRREINFIKMAQEINNINVFNQMYELMNDYFYLQQIFFHQYEKSPNLLFVACEIFSKKLLKRQLLSSLDDLQYSSNASTFLDKKNSLYEISKKLYTLVNSTQQTMPPHILRSCLNAISCCMSATITSSSVQDSTIQQYFKFLAPDFNFLDSFLKPNQSKLTFVNTSAVINPHHQYVTVVLSNLLDFTINSTYFSNYYYFRRNLYSFRNNYLPYLLNYSIFLLKSEIKYPLNNPGNFAFFVQKIRPALKLFQSVITYPFNLNVHEYDVEDQMHENISGLQSEIYFPTCFRNLLCDTGFLMDIIRYYILLNEFTNVIDPVREDLYSLIRIIGRVISPSEYIFSCQQQKKAFRSLVINFITQILTNSKFYDGYLILCITKINIKYMSIQNDDELFEGKREYFHGLKKFIINGMLYSSGKIEDGDKHPFRQLFEMLTAFVNITANTVLDFESKQCAQQALTILLKNRLTNNNENSSVMKQFGSNNSQQIQNFSEIFSRVPQIFQINLNTNLGILHQLNLSALNQQSLTFWLHLTAILLPQHDTTVQQTQLILKFFQAAGRTRSIGSLHYMQTLVDQILYQIKDGTSTTYLWRFIQQTKKISFQNFLIQVIKYALEILTVPNYALIENCLQLFKAMFSKLCKHRHKSFVKYFSIIQQQLCQKINNTMLVNPNFMKLRIGFYSIISLIWVNQGQTKYIYRIFTNIRKSLEDNNDFEHFTRYMTDITGLLEPVESSEICKLLLQLVILDMNTLLPYYFSTPAKLQQAFSNQIFLKAFVKFLLAIVNDTGYRLTNDIHTQLPFQIEQTFRPYLIELIKYDYPVKTIQIWLKFIKLNPLGKLLPFDKSFKQKNSPYYKALLREYFENLHRLDNLDQFYFMYNFIDGNVDLMSDWWEQIFVRGYKPKINIREVVNAHIWVNSKQKQFFGKLLFRISLYDENYWKNESNLINESKYGEWFVSAYP